ncbi:hypothetical protein STANM309S_04371 [Streptomyces tanashiensis]
MMNMSVLYLALPTLSRDWSPAAPELLWITDIYGFMVAGALITMGTLGDRIGHRRILLIGAVAFTAASVFAAYAQERRDARRRARRPGRRGRLPLRPPRSP